MSSNSSVTIPSNLSNYNRLRVCAAFQGNESRRIWLEFYRASRLGSSAKYYFYSSNETYIGIKLTLNWETGVINYTYNETSYYWKNQELNIQSIIAY